VRKLFAAAFGGLLLLGATPALAQTDPTYPVTSATDWTTGPQSDWQHQERGSYTFQAGMSTGVANRALTRWPQHYNPAYLFQHLADESQAATDATFHAHPDLPYDHVGDAGSPDYMPDFNHNGVFGDPGDFDNDTDTVLDSAPFRYPCPQLDGTMRYETVDGSCAATTDTNATFKLGEAREVKIVDARGYILDATLWLPGEALTTPSSGPFPGVVFSDGFDSRQDSYYWFAMRMARAGYIALTYDPAGQGESEGTSAALWDTRMAPCNIGGACRDLEDALRWFVGDDILPSPRDEWRTTPPKNPSYAPGGDNIMNPALGILDHSRVSIAGNSMGALATVDYARALGVGKGGDGRPLPPVRAAVPMSGIAPVQASIPIQFQTSDYDGSPTLAGPGVGGVALGDPSFGAIGYSNIKKGYDQLRASGQGSGPLELVVLEGGTHLDSVDIPYATRTAWSLSVAGDAALDWIDCHARDIPAACQRAVSSRPRLSRSFASEQDPDGPAGSEPSRCVTVPDQANVNQAPTDFAQAETGHPVYDCTP
jgi:hypothetical protein